MTKNKSQSRMVILHIILTHKTPNIIKKNTKTTHNTTSELVCKHSKHVK